MNTLTVALRCLQHPLALLSIAVLLLNDHVLKAAAPSLLTGKLSDFAGLFFFPFLLALVIALPLDRLHVPPRRTAAMAFSITALWFTLVKTWGWVNVVTVAALASVLGPSVQIVLDPTDLVALVMLWPAWRLWAQTEAAPAGKTSRITAVVTLAAAAFATMATSSLPPPYMKVTNVITEDSVVHAGAETNTPTWHFSSDDAGMTWQQPKSTATTEAIRQQLSSTIRTTKVCLPATPSECYSVADAKQVQVTYDSGSTWQTAWEIPPSRREFIRRTGPQPSNGRSPVIDRTFYAISLVESPHGSVILVAMGTEGVLVRQPNGAWERSPVGEHAKPTPFQAHGLWEAVSVLRGELLVGVLTILLAYVILCLPAWHIAEYQRSSALRLLYWDFFSSLVTGIGLIVFVFILLTMDFGDASFREPTSIVLILLHLGVWGILLGLPTVILRRAFDSDPSTRPWKNVTSRAFAGASFAVLAALLPMFWWTYGIISEYETARTAALVTGVLAFAVALSIVWDTTRAAAFGQPPPEAGHGQAAAGR